ncbi:MAG: DUF1552 domain-containing protein [Acidobacteria bacterium]|nr:DUF1552 domain-containing protein [Acidobacteriota bacterium]
MITQRHLSRRTLLRGLGTAIALPMFDAMTPAMAAPARSGPAPLRMAFTYVPNGIIMENWTPAADGKAFEFSRIIKPLEPFREKMLVLSGLTHNNGRALGDGPGDHARAAASFLTGAHPRKTAGADIKNGVSADQIAAITLGNRTRFASIELGIEHGRIVGNCDSGYSCAYSNSISWRSEATPMPPEVNPKLVFERLFGNGDVAETAASRAMRKSILDYVREDAATLQSSLGVSDKRKLDEYLTSVREIEKRIEASANTVGSTDAPSLEKPEGIPVDFEEHVQLMFDLQTVAYQTDSTRISTFMIGREGSNNTYRQIGVPDAHHGISHHQGDAEKIEKLTKINEHHLVQFAKWIEKLSKIQDGDGTLLDHSMIVYGSGLSDGNRHHHHDLPIVIAGGANKSLSMGRHVRYAKDTPLTNLYVSLLDRFGVKPETLGDSNGRLTDL